MAEATYRCTGCRKLFKAGPHRHGDRCPCGSGVWRLIAKVTRRMAEEHERALEGTR